MAQNTSGKQSSRDDRVATSNMINNDDDPDDLEEGEIADEDDDINENDTKQQTEAIIVTESPATKAIDKNSVKNNCGSGSSNNNNSSSSSGSSKNKKLPSNDVKTKSDGSSNKVSMPKILTLDNMTASDDWGRNVESAIAAVLRRDGIEPLQLPPSVVAKQKTSNESDNSNSGITAGGQSSIGTAKLSTVTNSNSPDHDRHGVKRRRKSRHQSSRSKRKKDSTNDSKRVDSDEIDEFEMICMRGGSPPPPQSSLTQIQSSTVAMSLDDDQYYSDDSYSSYGSYDSGGGSNRNTGGRNYDDRKNRRRNKDQSSSTSSTSRQQQSGQQSGSMSRNSGGGNSRKSGRDKRSSGRRGDLSDNDDRSDNRNNGPRKLELCKFYLMECCAKREKCLYMHSDFPCKYYYLGMKPHNQNLCKFSHGKPLTDQLRNILLKHLETAPKEILGDFPRINRDIATNMLNIQHQKLLKDFGMDSTTTTTTTSVNIGNNVIDDSIRRRIDDIVAMAVSSTATTNLSITSSTSLPSNVGITTGGATTKSDKPRKTRWCDRSPVKIQSQLIDNSETTSIISTIAAVSTLTTTAPTPTTTTATTLSSSTSTNDCHQTPSYLSLKNLTGVITAEQIEKLAAIGIENLEQINSLTVVQLNQYGLNIHQIHELALNAKNMEKLGLVKGNSGSGTSTTCSIAAVDDHHSNDSGTTVTFFGTGTGKDLDMRIPPSTLLPLTQTETPETRTITPEPSTNEQQLSGDVDMRFLSPNSVATLKTDCTPFQNIIGNTTQSTLPTATISSSLATVNDPMMIMSKPNDRTAMMFNYSAYIHNNSSDDDDDDDGGRGDNAAIEQKQEQFVNQQTMDSLDYSKYLKDSNLTKIDLLDDDDAAMVDNYYSTNRQTEDESGDEANNKLIIEEEMPFDGDETWRENISSIHKDSVSKKMPRKHFHHSDDNDSNNTNSSSDSSNDSSKYERDLMKSIETKAKSILPPPLPAIYDPSALYPSTKMNKIDISSSVTQYLNEGTTNKLSSSQNDDNNDDDLSFLLAFDTKRTKTDTNTTPATKTATILKSFVGDSGDDRDNDNSSDNNHNNDDEPLSSFVVSNKQATVISRDPRKLKSSSSSHHQQIGSGGGEKFEFFTRQIPELNHPTPLALDNNNQKIVKNTRKALAAQQKPDKEQKRRSIYRCPKNQIKSRKDDVDLRFPFKPVMANYIPAKEIDASITSHASIPYKVNEVDIPLTDYAEIRQNIILPTDEILDPRLRKLLESDSEDDDDDNDDDSDDDNDSNDDGENVNNDESTKTLNEEQENIESSSNNKLATQISDPLSAAKISIIQKRIDPRCAEPRIDPRTDPRRRAAAAALMRSPNVDQQIDTSTVSTSGTVVTSSAATTSTTPANIDVQLILQSSDWYTNLSSKQKIMVNQQLALLSSELKRHHMDTNPNKMFDMTFIQINAILQTILTNLNIFINDQGQIVQLPNNNGGTEFIQPPPSLQQQPQQHLQPPPTQSIGLLGHAPPGAEILGIPKFMHPNIMGPPRFGNRMMFDNQSGQQPPAGIMGMNSMFNNSGGGGVVDNAQYLGYEHDGGTNFLPPNMFDGRQGGGYFGGSNRDDRGGGGGGNRNFRGGCQPLQRHQAPPSLPPNNNDRWNNSVGVGAIGMGNNIPGGPPIMRGNNRNQMGGNRRNMNYDNRDRMWRDKQQ